MTFSVIVAVVLAASVKQLEPGQYTRQLVVDERERNYIVYIPKSRDGEVWPVVLAFHGGGSNAEQMIEFCGLNAKADQSGFLVVYPNGTGRLERALTFNGGNCCGYAQSQNVDDVKFVAAVLDDLASVISIDTNRVFATGMSNGAILCYRLADQLSDRIAAIAPVAGPMGTQTCRPSRPVSVCHFHGTEDQFAAFSGGPGKRSRTLTNFFSVQHSIDAWVKANGCDLTAQVEQLPTKIADGTSIKRSLHPNGKDGAEVVLYTIQGGGHTWPGRQPRLGFLGKSTQNVSANDVMWEFFQEHERK